MSVTDVSVETLESWFDLPSAERDSVVPDRYDAEFPPQTHQDSWWMARKRRQRIVKALRSGVLPIDDLQRSWTWGTWSRLGYQTFDAYLASLT